MDLNQIVFDAPASPQTRELLVDMAEEAASRAAALRAAKQAPVTVMPTILTTSPKSAAAGAATLYGPAVAKPVAMPLVSDEAALNFIVDNMHRHVLPCAIKCSHKGYEARGLLVGFKANKRLGQWDFSIIAEDPLTNVVSVKRKGVRGQTAEVLPPGQRVTTTFAMPAWISTTYFVGDVNGDLADTTPYKRNAYHSNVVMLQIGKNGDWMPLGTVIPEFMRLKLKKGFSREFSMPQKLRQWACGLALHGPRVQGPPMEYQEPAVTGRDHLQNELNEFKEPLVTGRSSLLGRRAPAAGSVQEVLQSPGKRRRTVSQEESPSMLMRDLSLRDLSLRDLSLQAHDALKEVLNQPIVAASSTPLPPPLAPLVLPPPLVIPSDVLPSDASPQSAAPSDASPQSAAPSDVSPQSAAPSDIGSELRLTMTFADHVYDEFNQESIGIFPMEDFTFGDASAADPRLVEFFGN